MNINVIIAGYKAHASYVFKGIRTQKNINIIGVFTGNDDNFCLLGEKPIGEQAREIGIPVYVPEQLTLETMQSISNKGNRIDLLLLVEWRKLIPESILSFPVYGTFNIHDSLLPHYRGSSPMNWAIINGLSRSGVTLYRITKKADSGPIYAQEEIDIDFIDYAIDVLNKVIKVYEKFGMSIVDVIINNPKPMIQDESKATYCAKRLPQDGLLDFRCDVMTIYNTVRALSYPFPGAFAFYDGIKVTITKASIVPEKYNYVGCIPGYLLRTEKNWVLCGSGILCIEEIRAIKNGTEINDPKELFLDKSIRLLSRPEKY